MKVVIKIFESIFVLIIAFLITYNSIDNYQDNDTISFIRFISNSIISFVIILSFVFTIYSILRTFLIFFINRHISLYGNKNGLSEP